MIYFIQHGDDGPVKIGMVAGKNKKAIATRLSGLQVGNPVKLHLIGFCDGGKKEEILLHKQFDDRRVSGEWFEINPELIHLIETMSIENEEARLLWDKTLSIKELVEELKDEITSRITRMRLLSIISKDKEVPHYRIFGEKRYKYEDCKDYIMRTYKTR